MLLLLTRHSTNLAETNDDQFTRIEKLNKEHHLKMNELRNRLTASEEELEKAKGNISNLENEL